MRWAGSTPNFMKSFNRKFRISYKNKYNVLVYDYYSRKEQAMIKFGEVCQDKENYDIKVFDRQLKQLVAECRWSNENE